MLSTSGGHKVDFISHLHSEVTDSDRASTSTLRKIESSQSQRGEANYLQVIARAPSSLTAILTSHPYNMPVNLLDKLGTSHDVQSMSRRLTTGTGGGFHFDSECVIFMLLTSASITKSSYRLQPFFQRILRTTWLSLAEWPSCGVNLITCTRGPAPGIECLLGVRAQA